MKIVEYILLSFFIAVLLLALYEIVALATGWLPYIDIAHLLHLRGG